MLELNLFFDSVNKVIIYGKLLFFLEVLLGKKIMKH